MKHLLTLFLSVIITAVSAQQQQGKFWCGTETDPTWWQQFRSKDRTDLTFDNSGRGGIKWIPVFYHIITKSDGTGGVGYKSIFETHCEINQAYNQFDIGFFIEGIDTIKNTTLWEYQNQFLGYQAFGQYNEPNVCNVYINGNLPGLCGFATFPGTAPSGGGIFMDDGCLGTGTTTFHHEMGHYLGLPHTFEDSDGIEFVNGSNCNSAGDLFCDTPADFLADRTPCPYNGTQTDPNGDLYATVIDETLYMSYFLDECTNRFSNQQEAEMNSVLLNERPNLLNQTVPDLSPLAVATFTSPTPNDSTIVGTITVSWNPIPGARYYFFRFQSATSSIVYVDTVIETTSFTITGLPAGKSFKYRVKGVSYGNACSAFTPYVQVSTSIINVGIQKQGPSCPGEANASITLSPSNGTAPYTFTWSNSATTASIQNIAAGVYTVTITDANGAVAVTSVTVSEPAPIAVSINKVGNNLTALPSGGTPPYSYLWSNGEQFAGNNGITFGTYVVTVTDSKGCTATETFVFSSAGIELQQKTSMKVYPNPVSNGSELQVEIFTNKQTNAVFQLTGVNGNLIAEQQLNLTEGANKAGLSTSNLPSGVYYIRLTSEGSTQTMRVSVIR